MGSVRISEVSQNAMNVKQNTSDKTMGTALPIMVARAVRDFTEEKSNESGKNCTRAASCGVSTRQALGCM